MLTLALSERSRWGALVAAVACALVLPGLDGAGFWDPHELDAVEGGAWSARLGLGAGELGARLPRALAGVAAAMVAYVWASRAAGARVGVVAAILVAASPVVVASSRQVTGAGDLELVFGQGLIIAGATAMVWPRGWPSIALGGAAVALGGAVACAWGGALLGLAVPAAAVAVAASAAGRARIAAVAAVAGCVTAALALAGVASLGPAWAEAPRELAWSAGLEGIAYGMFPWVALVPAAVARGARGGGGERGFVAVLAIAWTVAAAIACAGLGLGVGPARFGAVCGAALVVALWLDDAWPPPEPSPAERGRGLSAGAGAGVSAGAGVGVGVRVSAGAVVLGVLLVVVLARDLAVFPDRLASIALSGRVAEVVAGRGLRAIPVAVGALFVVALVLLARGRRRRVAVTLAVAACVLGAALHSWVWTPSVSRHLSARHLFDRYHALAAPGEPLAVLSVPARVSELYAAGARRAARPGDVARLLAETDRAFALVPQRTLCEVTQRVRAGGGAVHVLDDSEALALISNQHRPGEPRVAGLEEDFFAREPRPARRLDAVLADGVDIVGVDMPARVGRGDSFEMTLYYRVRQPPSRPWKVFVHFDGPGAVRFQGDHEPVGGRCPPTRWNAGDFVADRFTVKAGSFAQPGGRYRVWVGFFVGSSPSWTNMQVVSGEADGHDRVAAGILEVR